MRMAERFGSAAVTDRVGSGEREVTVVERRELADRVVGLLLADPAGEPLPTWEPGAHVEVALPGDYVRQYSLCGSPHNVGLWRIAVLREPAGRGGSALIHDEIHDGVRLRVRGPRNHFPLREAPRYVFIAGGIGITPILPMVEAVARAGRDWVLHYGGRTGRSMAFVNELGRYGERVVLAPEDEAGPLPLPDILGRPRAGVSVYCCGPPGLITAVEEQCREWPTGSLHVERFTADGPPSGGQRQPIEVTCARSGRVLHVPPDRSILEVAEAAGLGPPSSCAEGICGTCETAILDGEPEHLDSLLSDQERADGRTMLICVSRARSPRLVLDL
jgi:ferredoxin-NADP reductase